MDSSTELQKPNKESQKYKEGQKIEFCQWYGTSYEVYKWDEKNDDRKLIAIKKVAIAYVSASAAEYQNESAKPIQNAPINPDKINEKFEAFE